MKLINNSFYIPESMEQYLGENQEIPEINIINWCKENIENFKNDKFLFDMYTILITGSRKMTPKMIGAVQKAMVNPKYDPIKMIERRDKMKPILEKINRVWELVAEIDEGKNDWYLANYSALPFVNSLKEQFERNAMLSEKQMNALNSVFKKYKKRWENKEK